MTSDVVRCSLCDNQMPANSEACFVCGTPNPFYALYSSAAQDETSSASSEREDSVGGPGEPILASATSGENERTDYSAGEFDLSALFVQPQPQVDETSAEAPPHTSGLDLSSLFSWGDDSASTSAESSDAEDALDADAATTNGTDADAGESPLLAQDESPDVSATAETPPHIPTADDGAQMAQPSDDGDANEAMEHPHVSVAVGEETQLASEEEARDVGKDDIDTDVDADVEESVAEVETDVEEVAVETPSEVEEPVTEEPDLLAGPDVLPTDTGDMVAADEEEEIELEAVAPGEAVPDEELSDEEPLQVEPDQVSLEAYSAQDVPDEVEEAPEAEGIGGTAIEDRAAHEGAVADSTDVPGADDSVDGSTHPGDGSDDGNIEAMGEAPDAGTSMEAGDVSEAPDTLTEDDEPSSIGEGESEPAAYTSEAAHDVEPAVPVPDVAIVTSELAPYAEPEPQPVVDTSIVEAAPALTIPPLEAAPDTVSENIVPAETLAKMYATKRPSPKAVKALPEETLHGVTGQEIATHTPDTVEQVVDDSSASEANDAGTEVHALDAAVAQEDQLAALQLPSETGEEAGSEAVIADVAEEPAADEAPAVPVPDVTIHAGADRDLEPEVEETPRFTYPEADGALSTEQSEAGEHLAVEQPQPIAVEQTAPGEASETLEQEHTADVTDAADSAVLPPDNEPVDEAMIAEAQVTHEADLATTLVQSEVEAEPVEAEVGESPTIGEDATAEVASPAPQPEQATLYDLESLFASLPVEEREYTYADEPADEDLAPYEPPQDEAYGETGQPIAVPVTLPVTIQEPSATPGDVLPMYVPDATRHEPPVSADSEAVPAPPDVSIVEAPQDEAAYSGVAVPVEAPVAQDTISPSPGIAPVVSEEQRGGNVTQAQAPVLHTSSSPVWAPPPPPPPPTPYGGLPIRVEPDLWPAYVPPAPSEPGANVAQTPVVAPVPPPEQAPELAHHLVEPSPVQAQPEPPMQPIEAEPQPQPQPQPEVVQPQPQPQLQVESQPQLEVVQPATEASTVDTAPLTTYTETPPATVADAGAGAGGVLDLSTFFEQIEIDTSARPIPRPTIATQEPPPAEASPEVAASDVPPAQSEPPASPRPQTIMPVTITPYPGMQPPVSNVYQPGQSSAYDASAWQSFAGGGSGSSGQASASQQQPPAQQEQVSWAQFAQAGAPDPYTVGVGPSDQPDPNAWQPTPGMPRPQRGTPEYDAMVRAALAQRGISYNPSTPASPQASAPTTQPQRQPATEPQPDQPRPKPGTPEYDEMVRAALAHRGISTGPLPSKPAQASQPYQSPQQPQSQPAWQPQPDPGQPRPKPGTPEYDEMVKAALAQRGISTGPLPSQPSSQGTQAQSYDSGQPRPKPGTPEYEEMVRRALNERRQREG